MLSLQRPQPFYAVIAVSDRSVCFVNEWNQRQSSQNGSRLTRTTGVAIGHQSLQTTKRYTHATELRKKATPLRPSPAIMIKMEKLVKNAEGVVSQPPLTSG